ncbi:MAG: biofilm PGA synthesis lipoprotein PgaB [Lentisphaeria bacterium]|jgi:biofilm PGA synthesis lipoprotein PgaB
MTLVRCVIFVLWGAMAVRSHALVVLQYHHISDVAPVSTSISPLLFEAHLNFLEQQKFQVVSIEQLKIWLNNGKRLPDKTVVITFDDGYRSIYTEAYPRLLKRKWPFTIFVNSLPHDDKNPRYLSWEQMREMAAHGATIGNHSDSHTYMIRQRADETYMQFAQRRQREIEFAEQRIKKEIGVSHKLFAYPFGEYDVKLKKLLKRLGFLAFGQQSGPVSLASEQQLLPRFAFGGDYGDLDGFASKVYSLPFPERRVSVTDNSGKVLDNPELPLNETRPVLRIASPLMPYIQGMACYASGQGAIKAEIKGSMLVARAIAPLPAGRSRYNCTASAGGGRFYWYTQMFIRRTANGQYVDE